MRNSLILALLTGFAFLFYPAKNVGQQDLRSIDIGFWTVEQDQNGVWWFVSPEGKREFLTNVTTLQPVQKSRVDGSPHFESKDFDGNFDNWARRTSQRVRDIGFKGSGAWSHPAIAPYLPYTKDLNVIASTIHPVGSDAWIREVDQIVKAAVVPLKNDNNLIGYYLDNELDWESLEQHAPIYFQTVSTAIRRHDPNHLILGVRFHHRPPLSVLRASIGYVDVHSFNIYTDEAIVWKNMFREAYEITGCPIILSEFGFFADSNRSGNLNDNWLGGGRVRTQSQRAQNYRFVVIGMAETSFMVGTEFFQWNDEPPMGRFDGENLNSGIVDIFDLPYELLVHAVRQANGIANVVHEKSDDLQLGAVWKDDPKR